MLEMTKQNVQMVRVSNQKPKQISFSSTPKLIRCQNTSHKWCFNRRFAQKGKNNSNDKDSSELVYKNTVTKIVSLLLSKEKVDNKTNPNNFFVKIKRNGPKFSLEKLATKLDKVLSVKQSFVTGDVDPSLYAENFEFEDPGFYKLNK